jgi:transposase-like protein
MEHERSTRRYLTREQRRRIAERSRTSGLAPGDFARRHGYALSSLQRRLAKDRRQSHAFFAPEVTLLTAVPCAAESCRCR